MHELMVQDPKVTLKSRLNMQKSMKKVLVTGAGGFLGRTLIQALISRGCHVVCVDHFVTNRPESLPSKQTEIVRTDIRDKAALTRAMNGVDAVFHLAAACNTRSLQRSREINVKGTRRVAEAARDQCRPPTFVYVSSLAAAGPRNTACRESDPCAPVSHYGRTKLEAENVLRAMSDQLPVTIVRPPCVFGPGDMNLLTLFRTVKRGWNFVTSQTYSYSFLYIDDLIDGLIAAVQYGQRVSSVEDQSNPGIYYLCDQHAVTFPELGEMIADVLNRKRVRHVEIPRSLCWAIGATSDVVSRIARKKFYMNLDKIREGLAGSWLCDCSRASRELRFAPAASLKTRLQETNQFYQSAKLL